MRERDIEKYLGKKVKEIGGSTFKITSPGAAGFPDRLVVLPGIMFFCEVKAPGKDLRPLQEIMIQHLLSFGIEVVVVDSKAGVDTICRIYKEVLENAKQ